MDHPSGQVAIDVPNDSIEPMKTLSVPDLSNSRNSSPRLSLDSDVSSAENVSSTTSTFTLSNGSNGSHRTSFLAEVVNLTEKSGPVSCSLVWNNLTYSVESQRWKSNGISMQRQTTRKVIFQNLNGEARSGSLTAVIGQSGVGKSSLLESLAGRRKKGLKGEAYLKVSGLCGTKSNNNNTSLLSFIPQKDSHLPCLTVGETLLFASRLKNYDQARRIMRDCDRGSEMKINQSWKFCSELDYHNFLIRQLQKDLCLESCWDVKVSRCSGGELKRLSMAVELVSNPKMIILDEPTTGLDSMSAYHCIEVLNCLTEMNSPPGIVISIHQPSSDLLNLFHNVYVIGAGGRCIYNGPTDKLVGHLADKGLCCPLYYNPAEFIIQVASGAFGEKMLTILAESSAHHQHHRHSHTPSDRYHEDQCDRIDVKKLFEQTNSKRHPTFHHIWLLLQRSWKISIRQPMMTWLRLSQYLLVGLILSFLHSYKIGELDGCYTDVIQGATSFSASENYGQLLARINDNTATIYFALMFLVGAAIVPTVLTFPTEVTVMVNERHNGWYSNFSYFFAKMTAELPLTMALPLMFCGIFYYLTGQIGEWWRFGMFTTVIILLSIIGQNIGLIMGAIFVGDPASAVFMAFSTLCPIFLVGGFLLRESILVWFLRPLWYASYVRYGFASIIASLYGFGRCSSEYKSTVQKSILPRLSELIQDEEFGCVYDQYQLNSECFDGVMRECNTTVDSLYRLGVGQQEAKFTEEMNQYDGSFVMSYYEVNDSHFVFNIVVLVVYCLILLSINYWILLYKVKRRVKK
ncbi:ATP-binding cassette sub-family G member 1-like [Brevipalpus obovatus]|uniref:ATP-binding cassette sub-family G member 1-like n=1 Tax=Brevipalpus obovatus TaxID=246614 RepID=UPI003D9EBE26